jgi:hypothetical protein
MMNICYLKTLSKFFISVDKIFTIFRSEYLYSALMC